MVELDEQTIDVLKKVKDAIKETSFDINHFTVADTGSGGTVIMIDLRKHEATK